MYNNPIKDWFYFNRLQRRGIILLLALIVMVPLASRMIAGCQKARSIDKVAFREDLRRWEAILSDLESQTTRAEGKYGTPARKNQKEQDHVALAERPESRGLTESSVPVIQAVLFDPNLIGQEEWEAMGVPAYLARTIGNYLRAGGRFRYREDLRRIYLMEEAIYEQLEAYVDLPTRARAQEARDSGSPKSGQNSGRHGGTSEQPAVASRQPGSDINPSGDQQAIRQRQDLAKSYAGADHEGSTQQKDGGGHPVLVDRQATAGRKNGEGRDPLQVRLASSDSKTGKSPLPININLADTLELLRLWGIGPVFSRRIIRYREILGGFHDASQLLEVFGMDSTRFAGIKNEILIDTLLIRQIDINAAGFGELVRHPYIDRNLANAILNLRQQHGNYQCISQIRRSYLVCDSLFHQVSPYLKTLR